MKDVFVHSAAIVETDRIGAGTRIWAFAHVMKGASVGESCNIGEHCFIEAGVSVGRGCTIKNANMLWEGVTLEDYVFVGPHVFFTNDRYPRSPRLPDAAARYETREGWLERTTVRTGASLGAAAVLLPGVTIGAFATVAAAAVVTGDVPPHALVRGNPARVVGWVCRCGRPLHTATGGANCGGCGQRYEMEGGRVVLRLDPGSAQ